MKLLAPLAPLALALASTLAATAHATDCDVNALQAYQTAKTRGWQFECYRYGSLGAEAMPVSLVTYPPDKIGCVFKTPPVLGTITSLGQGRFFKRTAGSRPNLDNGWKVKSFEVTGAQWSAVGSDFDANVRVPFRIVENPKPNHTYNVRLSKLTLTKSGGVCSKAIDEAF